MTDEIRLRCARLVRSDRVDHDTTLVVADGRIVATTAAEEGDARADGWVVPGFVDTHCHGGGGADFATSDPDEALRARDFHRGRGTTTIMASLVTAPVDDLVRQLRVLAPLVAAGDLAGVHMEGPFLSAARRGAHDPGLLRDPEPALVDRLLEGGGPALAMVTLAPERPGALAAIRRLSEAGVTVAVGHTDAEVEDVRAALDAGARVATHLFNAMPPMHHRDPGPVPLLLTDPRVGVELILDGLHLDPDVVRMAVAAAGPDRVLAVSDATPAAGQPDGVYALGGLQVRVSAGAAHLVGESGEIGALAGSTSTMADAFSFGVALGLDVPTMAAITATTPARVHGLADVGVLEPGRRADLCVLDQTGRLLRVMAAGRWLER